MSDESKEHRYIFIVRQQFGEQPNIDSFYELQVPSGITSDQAKIMARLKEDWCIDEIRADTSALKGMNLRLRFNSDMYQSVCLVRTTCPITNEDLDSIIKQKYECDELKDFLAECSIKT